MSLKVLIFLISLPIIYHQLQGKYPAEGLSGVAERLLSGTGAWLSLAAIGLVLANWTLEAAKWRALSSLAVPINLRQSLGSVLSGVYISLFTPNRSGEFLGRIAYLPNGKRIEGALLSFCGSLAQISITIMAGTIGLVLFLAEAGQQYAAITTSVLGILASAFVFFIYTNFEAVIHPFFKLKLLKKYEPHLLALAQVPMAVRGRVWFLSALRYAVFSLQFLLLLWAFDVDIATPQALSGISASFLGNFAIPSLTLTELGVRGITAMYFMGAYTADAMGIALATYSLWFINILLPAVAGGIKVLMAKWDGGRLV